MLVGENAAHAHVLRLRVGEEIVVVAGDEVVEYVCAVTEISKPQVLAKVIGSQPITTEFPFELVLYQALPKGNKMGEIVERAVELGVSRIVPIITARCVAAKPKDEANKLLRWQKIAEAIAKLSHRGRIPKISNIATLNEVLSSDVALHTSFVCYELEKVRTIKQQLSKLNFENVACVSFFIGSEGGFEVDEIDLLKKHGVQPVSLGNRILRTESAAAMVLANIAYAASIE